jgi:FecR protein
MFDKCKLAPRLLLAIGFLAASAFAGSVVPGTLNYVEGSVTLDGTALTSAAIGTATLGQNQVLATAQGKAEMLLTPGVFLRLGENSSVRLVSPNLADTRVALLNGQATVEVTELFKENRLQLAVGNTTTTLLKPGLYEFNADRPQLAVYDGEASIADGDRQIKVKEGHQAQLTGTFAVSKFDRKRQQDQLYAWSNLRSEYEAQASAESAQVIYAGGGPWWASPGWYWNPYWATYGFLPGDGILYSPFGWPFFSPRFAYYAPIYFRGGFGAGRGFVARGFAGGHPSGFAAAPHVSGGFHAGGFAGGGFHGGGGGGHR